MPRELDFEEPFRTEVRLSRHPLYVFVLGSDPEPSEEVRIQGLIGITPDELGLCQSLDADLPSIFAWLEGEEEPEEGDLFLANPAVKNHYINRNLFLLDDHKKERKSGEEGEKRLLVVPLELRLCHDVPVADTRDRQDHGQA